MLNGLEAGVSPSSRDKSNIKLGLLANISIILTIGDDDSPLAHSVHAVSGRIEENAIECLVCAENTGQAQASSEKGKKYGKGKAAPVIPEAGRLEELERAGDASRGYELLQKWDEPVEEGFKCVNY